MNVYDWIKKYLTDRGVFDGDAASIISTIDDDTITDIFSKDVEGYPEILLNVLAVSVNRYAFNWFEANKPMAWNKSIFA